jgi:hypothetical protein
LRPKALAVIFILIFLVLLVMGIGAGDLEEALFNGGML